MIAEHSLTTIAWAAAVILAAFIVRGMSGYGAGLVATPLLAQVMPLKDAVPLNGL